MCVSMFFFNKMPTKMWAHIVDLYLVS